MLQVSHHLSLLSSKAGHSADVLGVLLRQLASVTRSPYRLYASLVPPDFLALHPSAKLVDVQGILVQMKDGILLIDKPANWTSFDVVARIRSQLRHASSRNQVASSKECSSSKFQNLKSKIKVGHAGTLDPFATGLLIILLGEECKNASTYLKLDKTYEFTAKLGETSTTGDPEGKKIKITDRRPEIEEIEKILQQFTGEISQTPPAFSAIKINGQRAYKLVRQGKSFELPARKVTISRLQVTDYDYPYLKCVCDVSSGTYIRSLVEDIGKSLGVGAYCTELRRTQIGEFSIEDALSVEAILQTLI